MQAIVDIFRDTFRHWQIELPAECMRERLPGQIVKAGWAIWFRFGENRRGSYMDYYASHRMTDDRHVRIYADGVIKHLHSLPAMRRVSQDPVEEAHIVARYNARVNRVTRMLNAKGFGLTGGEPGGVAMNWHLRSTPGDSD